MTAWRASGTAASDEKPNLGYKPRHKEGYFPVPPIDSQEDIRSEMVEEMQKVGIYVERQHHEVATAGQAEIDIRFSPLVKCADQLMYFKYIIKNVAKRHNKTVTFMPKPLFGDNGSGMHTHQSIWKGGKPLFSGNEYAGILETRTSLHRRHFETCQGARCIHEPDHEFIQATDPWLRGSGEPCLLEQKPLGLHSHPHV